MEPERYAVIVVDLRTGEPRKLPGRYLGETGRQAAYRDATDRTDDDRKAWVVALQKG